MGIQLKAMGFVRTDAEELPGTGASQTYRERWSSTRSIRKGSGTSNRVSAWS
jgi:hypothetical protein